MTYQPYPTGSGLGNDMPAAQRPPQPSTLINAVRLMWAGAGLALLDAILVLAFSGKIKSAVTKAAIKANATAVSRGRVPLTTAQIHSLANLVIVLFLVEQVVAILLWLWMAWANNRGRGWARIVASVLFGLSTISLIFSVGRASITVILLVISWLVGLIAMVFLWRKETSAYISAVRTR